MKTVSVVLLASVLSCAFVQSVSAAEPAKFSEKVVYSFGGGTDGAYPQAGLIDVDGILYGTTVAGGIKVCARGIRGCGTAFSLDLRSGAEKVLHTFCFQPKCADGAFPLASLVKVSDGTLYGTTSNGGIYGSGVAGTVFSIDTTTGAETVRHSFGGSNVDGYSPIASLIDVNGLLYGTTQGGGTGVYGTAFTLDPGTGTETVLYPFCSQTNCKDGKNPNSALIDVTGTLYGTTSGPGAGKAFSLDPNAGAEKVLYTFCSQQNCADGENPGAASLIDVNGMLYGTTFQGGITGRCGQGCGTVFSLDPNTGAEKVLYSFGGGTDGANPRASLIDINGALYGTTAEGGIGCVPYGCGTVFSVNPNTGAEKVLYTFCRQKKCADGANPLANLIDVKGSLYGTTNDGGAHGYGAVFALKKNR